MDKGDERAVVVNVLPHIVVDRVRENPARRGLVARTTACDIHACVRVVVSQVYHRSGAQVPLEQAIVLEELHISCVGMAAHRSGIGVLGKRVAREVRNSSTRLVRKLRVTHRVCGRGKCEGESRYDERRETRAHGHAVHALL